MRGFHPVVRRRLATALLALLPMGAWAADPQITSLTDTPDPATAGGLYTYAIGIDNTDASDATNTVVTLSVPAGATFVSASPTNANCVATSATLVTCSVGTLAGNGTGARTVNVTWRATAAGTISATANISADSDSNLGNNTQNATTTVLAGADLRLTKIDSPDPVVGGANVTYTLTASNDGPNASGNLVLTDNLPGSSTFVSASGTGWSCSHAAGVVTCTRNGPLAVGASAPPVTIVARIIASTGFVTNSATISPAVGAVADPDNSNNTATATTQVLPGADVRIDSKGVSPNPVIAGENATFTITPRNGGPAIANTVAVTDTLPSGWTFVSATGTGWSCSASGQTVTCSRATYAVGGADNITLVATAPTNAVIGPTGRTDTNTATITTTDNDPNTSNNSNGVTFDILPDGADLRLAKSKSPNPVAQGSQVTSTITVTNGGPRRATGPLRVVDQLSGETYVSESGTGWTCSVSGSTVTCDHPNAAGLNAGASLPTLTIITTATVAGSATNQACTGSSLPGGAAGATARQPLEGDPNPTNDCNSASTSSTSVRPDLAITKTTSTPTGGDKIVSATEDRVTYTLVVTNVSPTAEDATGVRISDTVPAFLTSGAFPSSIVAPVVATVAGVGSTATFNCAVSSATVICTQTGGVLAQGGTVTVPITVLRGLLAGDFTNSSTVENTVEGDPDRSNNTATDTVTIAPLADMQMTGKSITPGTVKAGEVATYVLSFRNNGPSTAQNVVVTDIFTFPAGDTGYTVTQITPSKGSCAFNAGTNPNGVGVDDVLGPARNSFTCQIGSMASGETQTVTLKGRPNFQAGNAARVFTNVVNVTTTTPERSDGTDGGNNAQGPVTLNVDPASLDLLVNKDDTGFDPIAFTSGSTFLSYRVNATNNGPSYATGVKITETMTPPAGKRIRFVCDTTTFGGSTCNTGPLALCSVSDVTSGVGTAIPAFTCDVPPGNATTGLGKGDLAIGQTKSIFLRFEVLDNPSTTGDTFTNQAIVSANEPDTLAANDTESEQTTVRRRVDLAVTKAAKKAGAPITTVALREPFDWEVIVTNNGPSESLQTILTDTLPAGSDLVGVISWTKTLPAATGTCPDSGVCTMGQLDAGGQITITVPTRLSAYPSGGVATNSATVNTDPTNLGGIDTTPLDNTATANVNVTRASIAGTVFQDRVRDGANGGTPQAAAQEPRIQGVTLTLTGNDLFGDPVNATATTDTNGDYLFNNLPPSSTGGVGGYTITQTQPAGFINGTVDPPTAGGSEPSNGGPYTRGGTSGNSLFANIVVDGDDAAIRYHFPEIKQPSLSGLVYLDVNANDVRDPATDTGVSGATVRLLNATTLAQIATTTTGADGAYAFTGLDPLVAYTLEQPLPTTLANLRNGAVNPGQIGGAACTTGCTAQPNTPAADTDRIADIDLASGADGTVFNFGERQLAGVSGLVYVDKNRNNALDGSDTGRLAGVTVRLVQGASCAAGTELQSTTTAVDGSYAFSGVLAFQNYLLCETQPTGYGVGNANGTAGSNEITLTNLAAAGSANNNFGALVGSLAGSVYQDTGAGTLANFNNGLRDAGEAGIAGVTVTLTGTDAAGAAVNRTATTDASGNYSFDDLLAAGAGGYTVTEGAIPPSAGSFNDGKTTAGAAGGTATAVDTLPSAISGIALGAGVQTTNYIFGELPRAGITGTVYTDRNRNDTMDAAPTDGRIAGVTLTLRDGSVCSAGTVLGTTTTGADGTYSFSGIAGGGTYTICETQPTDYADGTVNPGTSGTSSAANSITLTNLPSSGSADNNFGERVGSLAGSVYVDFSAATPANTNNGIRDAGEAGIAGVTVTLTGTDAAGGAVNRTATTDASGNYSFDDLLAAGAGGYTVTEGAIPPAAGTFLDGKTTAGAAGGTATAVNTLPSAISAINLGAGVQTTGYIFGELPNGSISGTVYIDRNRNDTIDPTPTDGRVAGVTVTLRDGTSCSAGTVLGTTTTNADGNYAFNDLSAGLDYAVCETQPIGYESGATNPGTNGTSSASNSIAITNLPTTGSANSNFGERVGSLAGSVYMDTNNDGQKQAGEPGLVGVVVTLTGTDATGGAVNRTATTDANGDYRFDDLLAAGAGGYTVTEQATQPTFEGKATINGRTTAGSTGGSATAVTLLPSAISAIPLAAGADSTAHLFGELLSVGLSGTVFADLANDGVQQLPADLGLAGVTLDLTGTDDLGAAVSATTTTAADGTYNFTGLRPGSYTVTEPTQPAGTVNGITTAGSTGGTATPVATLPSVISAIPLITSGAFSTGNNFAEIPNNSGIGGRVWLDLDNDGVIDAGESGIAGVSVTLTGTDTIGRPVERTLTTDAQGGYLFENLAPGSYTVTEPTQPAGTLNGRTNAGNGGGAATAVTTLPSAISGITLGIGQMVTANDFGEIPPARIAGRVYADNNGNGVVDSSEVGLAGVSLVLTGVDDLGAAVSVTLSSAPDGGYAFENLRPGTYTVTEPTQPPGTVNGITAAGSQGGTATPVSTLPSAISGIVLPVGGAATGNDFGELANSPDLRVTKTHAEPVFTVTKPATYSIRVLNLGEIATSAAYTVEDRLPAGLTLTSTPTGTGWSCTGATGASSFSCTASTVVAAGATNPNAITAIAVVGAAALNAPIANNAVLVEGGGEIPARRPTPAERDAFNNNPGALPECTVAPARNACRDPEDVQQSANLSGTVWYDIGTVQRQLDARDQLKQGWIVEVIDVNGVDPSRPNAAGERVSVATGGEGDARVTGGTPGAVVARAFTKADGSYLIENLIPNIDYSIRFRDPNSNVVFGYPVNGDRGPGSSGAQCLDRNKPINLESSCVDTGAVPQLTVRLAPGRNLVQQSLPIDPTGVVYDSGLRTPIPGATVTLAPVGACAAWDPSDDIVGATLGGYSVSGGAISMVTGADGLYQFLLSPSAPARCTFALTVTPPSGYSFISKLIAPTPGPVSPPGGPGSFFNVQPQADAPTGPVGPATTYYLSLSAGSAAPNILYNHIPLDPALPGTVLLDKTGDRSVVEVGDSVRYSITVSVPSGALPRQTTVVDRLPAGFTYIAGTATVNDRPIADPQGGVGPTLAFNLGRMGDTRQLVLRYRVRVGVGAQEGDGVNRAQAQSCGVPTGCVDGGFNPLPGSVATNEDRYRVRVTGGVFGTEACVLGKVFVDCNNNHVQDPEEIGIPGVRMVMSDGTTLISDSEGKYSVCGLEPKSTVMRVDPRTLPKGARMTTSSNRNLGDAGSLWLDLKNGELHRADFIEGSCAAPVIDQVKGRRAQGEIRAPETERPDGPALRFESDGPVIGPVRPREGERVTPVDAEPKGGAHGSP